MGPVPRSTHETASAVPVMPQSASNAETSHLWSSHASGALPATSAVPSSHTNRPFSAVDCVVVKLDEPVDETDVVTEAAAVLLPVDMTEEVAVLDPVQLMLELGVVVSLELIEVLLLEDRELDAVVEMVDDAVEVNVVVGEVIRHSENPPMCRCFIASFSHFALSLHVAKESMTKYPAEQANSRFDRKESTA